MARLGLGLFCVVSHNRSGDWNIGAIPADMDDLIQGGSGLRKVRWKLEGRGKSGGVRVIYYWVTADDQIQMLYVYPKGKQENLTQEQLAQLRKIVERWSDG